jgi:TRAP-type C4-dicarboxylate transport system permease small subunit
MKIIKWLDENLELYVLYLALTIIAVTMMTQVVLRYAFDSPLSWAEEFTRYAFVWSAFIGISYSIKRGIMINVDMVVNKLNIKAQKIINILIQIFVLVFFLFLFYHSIEVVKGIFASNQKSPAMGIPMGYVYLSSLVGFLLSSVRTLQNVVKMIKDSGNKESVA